MLRQIVKKIVVLMCCFGVNLGVRALNASDRNMIGTFTDYSTDYSTDYDTFNTFHTVNHKGGGGGHGGGGSHGSSGSRGSSGSKGKGTKSPGGKGNNAASAHPHPELPSQPKGTRFPTKDNVRGRPPERAEPDDPADYLLNLKFLYAQQIFIHNSNPCMWFQERLSSRKNKKRKKGCKHEANRMRNAGNRIPSSNCQDVAEGRCFQFSGQAGRCYFRTNSKGRDGDWVLADKCTPYSSPAVIPPTTAAPLGQQPPMQAQPQTPIQPQMPT